MRKRALLSAVTVTVLELDSVVNLTKIVKDLARLDAE